MAELNKKPTPYIWALRKNQDIKKIYSLEDTLVEVIKYGTKIFTDPKKSKKSSGVVKLYAKAYYNIICAMQGIRLFASFGFTLPKTDKLVSNAKEVTNYQEWKYVNEYHDWLHTESELTLFGYTPEEVLSELLDNSIDVILD
ncbi:MAG TPA: hypothetical protein VL098_11285 [Flavipsychrobacter sp.]|nr:hypothetical protein [Flavipsychrobacter sp.]